MISLDLPQNDVSAGKAIRIEIAQPDSSSDKCEVEEALNCAFTASSAPDRADALRIRDVGIAEPQILVPPPEPDWDDQRERRFHKLVVLASIGDISAEQAMELEGLTVERRQKYHPRSGEEIVLEYKRDELLRNLLRSFGAYVDFLHTPHQT